MPRALFVPDGCLCRGLRVLFEPRITLIAQMGCDAPRRFVPIVVCIGDCACCLNCGLRGFSQMGCDAPRRFVPMVVCIGDCACCLNRGLGVIFAGWAVMRRRPFGPLLSEPRITRIAQVGCGAFCRLMLRHGLKGLRILVPSRVGDGPDVRRLAMGIDSVCVTLKKERWRRCLSHEVNPTLRGVNLTGTSLCIKMMKQSSLKNVELQR